MIIAGIATSNVTAVTDSSESLKNHDMFMCLRNVSSARLMFIWALVVKYE